MKHTIFHCPKCHKVLGELMFDADAFDLTLPCPNCRNFPRFTHARPPQQDNWFRRIEPKVESFPPDGQPEEKRIGPSLFAITKEQWAKQPRPQG